MSRGDDTDDDTRVSRRSVLGATGAGLAVVGGIGLYAARQSPSVADATEQWRVETGGGISRSVTVVDGTVFLGDGRCAYALDAETGEERWHLHLGRNGTTAVLPPTVVDGRDSAEDPSGGGTVVVTSYDQYEGHVDALDATTGEHRWHAKVGFVVSSPTVADAGTIVVAGIKAKLHNSGGIVAGIDAATGDRQWTRETAGVGAYSPPVVSGGTAYVGGFAREGGYVHAIDVESGDQRWRAGIDPGFVSSPTVVGDTVIVGAGHSANDRLHRTVDSLVVDKGVYAFDAGSGDLQWYRPTAAAVEASPTVADISAVGKHRRTVFVGDHDGGVLALDARTGALRWRSRSDGPIASSPTVTDGGDSGTVVVGSDDGTLYGFDAATGRERVRFDAGAAIRSSPIAVDGTVYVGSGRDRLHAVEVDGIGTSVGSRVRLGALGHHDDWAHADLSVDAAESGPPPEDLVREDDGCERATVVRE